MVKGSWPGIAAVILAGLAGCNGLAGIREGIFDPCMEDAGDPVCVVHGATASSASGGGVGGGGSSTTSTSGTGGSIRSKCGNGVVDVDADEECDDGPSTAHGCTQCKVDCDEPGAFKDPATAHCYWVPESTQSFFESSVVCELSAGGRLATVTSATELGLIGTHVEGTVWIGATALGKNGEVVWLDDEPWGYAPWAPGQPNLGGKNLCVKLEGEPLLFQTDDCALARSAICERAP
jgi:lectin-like protein